MQSGKEGRNSDRRRIWRVRDTLVELLTGAAAAAGRQTAIALPGRLSAHVSTRASEPRPSMAKYVLIGAAIGATITGGSAAYRLRDCQDCIFAQVYVGGAIGVGALLGGLIESFVWADRYGDDPP